MNDKFVYSSLRPSQHFFSNVRREPPLPGYYQDLLGVLTVHCEIGSIKSELVSIKFEE